MSQNGIIYSLSCGGREESENKIYLHNQSMISNRKVKESPEEQNRP